MRKTNYHMHTRRCMHASGRDEEYVLSAIQNGYEEIGFSDHSPWKYDSDFVANMRMPLSKFDDYYAKGYLDYVITTNLNYRPEGILDRPWYQEADMSKYLAAIINSFNHDASMNYALSPTDKIQKLVRKYQAQSDGYEYYQTIK